MCSCNIRYLVSSSVFHSLTIVGDGDWLTKQNRTIADSHVLVDVVGFCEDGGGNYEEQAVGVDSED